MSLITGMRQLAVTLLLLPLLWLSASAHEGLHERIEAATNAIKKDPKNAQLYLERAELYRQHSAFALASKDLDSARKLAPEMAVIELLRGKLLLSSKKTTRAEGTVSEFLAKNPDSYEGLVTMSEIKIALKKDAEAVTFLTRAIELSPRDSIDLYIGRAQLQLKIGRGEDAVNGLDDGMTRLGRLISFETAAIDIEVTRRNFSGAVARLDGLIDKMPRPWTFLVRKGEVLIMAGRGCEAVEPLLKAEVYYQEMYLKVNVPPASRNSHAKLQKLLAQTKRLDCGVRP